MHKYRGAGGTSTLSTTAYDVYKMLNGLLGWLQQFRGLRLGIQPHAGSIVLPQKESHFHDIVQLLTRSMYTFYAKKGKGVDVNTINGPKNCCRTFFRYPLRD